MSIFRSRMTELPVSEAEIVAMTADLDDAHHDTLPHLRDALSGWGHDGPEASGGFSRRRFLASGSLLAAGGLLAASGTAAAAGTVSRLRGADGDARLSASAVPTDVTVAALAASLENLAVTTYAAALSAAQKGKLGTVPKAVGTFVITAMAQHKDHASAWNGLVSGAGYQSVTAPNAVLAKSVNASFAKVTDIAGLAKLALSLEEIAAATYLEAIAAVTSTKAIATAATIHPVEMQHAAILNFILGQYPVPAAYGTTALAAKVADAPSVKKR